MKKTFALLISKHISYSRFLLFQYKYLRFATRLLYNTYSVGKRCLTWKHMELKGKHKVNWLFSANDKYYLYTYTAPRFELVTAHTKVVKT